jgi:hypothetical protein
MTPELIARLLFAAEAAYGIVPGQPFQTSKRYAQIGFYHEPFILQAGPDNIDAALVACNQDGIIIALRGTLPPVAPVGMPVVLDWLQDFLAAPEQHPEFPGHVHAGFYRAMMQLWPQILQALQQLRTQYPDAGIYVTGHSKGGALCSLTAWLLHTQQLPSAGVVSFASPHAGDAEFASACEQAFTQLRYENYLDLVPCVPPRDELLNALAKLPEIGKLICKHGHCQYTPVGKLQYIQEDGTVVGESAFLSEVRIAETAFDLVSGRIQQIAHAHSLSDYLLDYSRAVVHAANPG